MPHKEKPEIVKFYEGLLGEYEDIKIKRMQAVSDTESYLATIPKTEGKRVLDMVSLMEKIMRE